VVDGVETSNEKDVADSFNSFFMEKVEKLSKSIDKTLAIDPTEKLRSTRRDKHVKSPLVFKTVQEAKVKRVIESLKPKVSSGKDELSAELLKLGGDILHVPLTYIINKSIVDGKFPSYWKEAVIKPLWKNKGSKEELKNYRPVALICLPGMVLEAIINEQLTYHLERNSLLGKFQFGYRHSRSTVTAVATMCCKAHADASKGRAVGMTMFDMSAAFDTVEKDTVCNKLKLLGVSNQAIEWIQSYLSGRKQRVKVGNTESKTMDIKLGTPQGSRLSPLLFNILTSDLDLYLKKGMQCNFADDTSNNVSDETVQKVVKKLEEDALGMMQFTASNNLVINPDKTAFICKGEKEPTELKVGSKKVISESHTELLGMIISGNLKWEDHVEQLKGKLRQRLGILRRLRHKLPAYTMKTIAEALFTSKMRAGISLYCKPRVNQNEESNRTLSELNVLQNEMMRIVTGRKLSDRISSKQMREELGIMSVNQLCCYHIIMETYSILVNETSEYIRDALIKMPEGSDLEGEQQYRRHARVPKSEGRNNNFLFYAATLWNMLPKHMKVTDFRSQEAEESAEPAGSCLTEKEEYLRQKKHKAREARKFKGEVKKWIALNIPQT
jgi:hypothetical protein